MRAAYASTTRADDPLAGLDFKLREQLVDDLRGLNTATGATVLYVTSDVIEAMTRATSSRMMTTHRGSEAQRDVVSVPRCLCVS